MCRKKVKCKEFESGLAIEVLGNQINAYLPWRVSSKSKTFFFSKLGTSLGFDDLSFADLSKSGIYILTRLAEIPEIRWIHFSRYYVYIRRKIFSKWENKDRIIEILDKSSPFAMEMNIVN